MILHDQSKMYIDNLFVPIFLADQKVEEEALLMLWI